MSAKIGLLKKINPSEKALPPYFPSYTALANYNAFSSDTSTQGVHRALQWFPMCAQDSSLRAWDENKVFLMLIKYKKISRSFVFISFFNFYVVPYAILVL